MRGPETRGELVGLVPAAGEGTRMAPFSLGKPKALIEVEGVTLLERALVALRNAGVARAVVVVGYRADEVTTFVSSRDFGLPVETVEQQERLGLSHAVSVAQHRLTGDTVVYCPDNIYTDARDVNRVLTDFARYRPPVLQTVTVVPSAERSRCRFFSGDLDRVDSHLLLSSGAESTKTEPRTGVALYSAGITILRKDILRHLPCFEGVENEMPFPNFLATVDASEGLMLSVLTGRRYDLTAPADIENYVSLRREVSRAKGRGVSCVLVARDHRVLLHLRDDAPGIRYPGHWALFGGSVDDGESPPEALKRELAEELGLDPGLFGLFREFVQNNKREYAYVGEIGADIDRLSLREGKAMRLFSPESVLDLKLRPDDRETLRLYLEGMSYA